MNPEYVVELRCGELYKCDRCGFVSVELRPDAALKPVPWYLACLTCGERSYPDKWPVAHRVVKAA